MVDGHVIQLDIGSLERVESADFEEEAALLRASLQEELYHSSAQLSFSWHPWPYLSPPGYAFDLGNRQRFTWISTLRQAAKYRAGGNGIPIKET